MRRDYFTLEVAPSSAAEGGPPSLVVTFEGPEGELRERLQGTGNGLSGDAVDVAFRLLGDVEDTDTRGVLSITDRITGEFLLELNAPAAEVTEFVRTVRTTREEGDDDQFRLVIEAAGGELATLEKRTFLVYDADGGLLRGHSLIPSGVEL